MRPDQVVLTLLHLKYVNSAIKWRWLSTMHVISQNNYKIENGSKKTFAIIPKSAKMIPNIWYIDTPITCIVASLIATVVVPSALRSTQ